MKEDKKETKTMQMNEKHVFIQANTVLQKLNVSTKRSVVFSWLLCMLLKFGRENDKVQQQKLRGHCF